MQNKCLLHKHSFHKKDASRLIDAYNVGYIITEMQYNGLVLGSFCKYLVTLYTINSHWRVIHYI